MIILGIDEVGRGPLAGPLVIGAVILPEPKPDWVNELKDSKKLSAKKREALSELILKESVTGLGWVSSRELDEIGISAALKLATIKAVKSVQRLHAPFSQIVIDGKVSFLAGTSLEKYVSTTPKADALIKEVSAASIIAKVARDHYMYELAAKYPEYGFDSHVGYGTAKHLAAIKEHGICPEHRQSFEPIKSMVGFTPPAKNVVKNTTSIGQKGEQAVIEYLENSGHTIIAKNHKTKFYEIDIISTKDKQIFFTEVKTRKNIIRGSGLDYITKDKLSKMRFAAESFLKFKPQYNSHDPILAAAAVDGNYRVRDWLVIH